MQPLPKKHDKKSEGIKGERNLEDDRIVQLYLDREESAVNETCSKYGKRLRLLSLGITLDSETSEECENDTYLEAWNRIPPDEPRTYLYAYLCRIIRCISIDRCREKTSLKRKAYIVELSDELASCIPSSENVENILDAKILGESINRYLHSLPKEKQIVFMRRYYYMDSIKDIGKRCGFNESKVKTMLFRLRNELREYLKKEECIL